MVSLSLKFQALSNRTPRTTFDSKPMYRYAREFVVVKSGSKKECRDRSKLKLVIAIGRWWYSVHGVKKAEVWR